MRALMMAAIVALFVAGCEKTIKEVHSGDSKAALASSSK
jgi:hypothetical protein